MSANVFSKLRGTTENQFTIGKAGPSVVRGTGVPTAFIDAVDGSIYLREDVVSVYQKANGSWFRLISEDTLPVTSYREEITPADLDENYSVVITHNLGQKFVLVQLYADDYKLSPDNIQVIDNNSLRLSLSSFSSDSVVVCVKI